MILFVAVLLKPLYVINFTEKPSRILSSLICFVFFFISPRFICGVCPDNFIKYKIPSITGFLSQVTFLLKCITSYGARMEDMNNWIQLHTLGIIRTRALLWQENSPTAQLRPWYPGGQSHLKPLTSSLHVPPLWHGLLTHSSISVKTTWRNRHNVPLCNIFVTVVSSFRENMVIHFFLSQLTLEFCILNIRCSVTLTHVHCKSNSSKMMKKTKSDASDHRVIS